MRREGVDFVDPHIVYGQNTDLDFGGMQLQMRSWGAEHFRGDQSV
jgi:hypothetical protein